MISKDNKKQIVRDIELSANDIEGNIRTIYELNKVEEAMTVVIEAFKYYAELNGDSDIVKSLDKIV